MQIKHLQKIIILILITLKIQILGSLASTPSITRPATPTPSLESVIIDPNEQSVLLDNSNSPDIRYANLEQALRKAKKTKEADNKKLAASIATTIAIAIFTIVQHYKLCESN